MRNFFSDAKRRLTEGESTGVVQRAAAQSGKILERYGVPQEWDNIGAVCSHEDWSGNILYFIH